MKNLKVSISLDMEIPEEWELIQHPDGVADHDRHRQCIANVFTNDSDCKVELASEQIEKLSDMALSIKNQYQSNGPKSINWNDVAIKPGMTALYNTVYRGISGDAAHVTVEALNRHIKPDAEITSST